MEFSVGNCPTLSIFTLPEISRFVLSPRPQMPVHSILGCVQQSSDKPLGKRRVPIQNLIPLLVPDKLTRNFGPKRFWVPEGISLQGEILLLRLVSLHHGWSAGVRHLQRVGFTIT